MNVFLLPKQKFRNFLLFVGLLCFGQIGVSQTFEYLETIKNESVSFSFDNYSTWSKPEIDYQAQNGTAAFSPSGGGNGKFGIATTFPTPNTIVYTPAPGFIGTDYFIVRYRKLIPNTSLATSADKIVAVTVWPTSVIAVDDYAMVSTGSSVTIEVLENDFSDGSDLTVYSVPHINNGTTVLVEDDTKVVFTPTPGFSGVAGFNYSICDSQGECDVATVSVCVLDNGATLLDPETIFTKKNTDQVILVPLEGFEVLSQDSTGTVEFTSDNVWIFSPKTDFVGNHNIIFENVITNQQQVVTVVVLDAAAPNTFLRDDVAYVTIDGETIIDALENDLGGAVLESVGLSNGNPTYTPNGGVVVYNYSSKEFIYTNNTGFEGIDEFNYKAYPPQYSGNLEIATVSVVVSDQKPAQTLFELKTPENTPLVIAYNIPIENYTFSNIDDANLVNGTVTFYEGAQTIPINGEAITGYNMLIYTPNANASVGLTDEFEFDYCIGEGTGNCQLVKIDIEIVNVNATNDPECSGQTCVWPGDTNTDGVVDIRDILPIGLCMGEIGLEREDGITDWYPQYAEDWSLLGLPGFNVKHIDVNGDGIIEAADTAAIPAYYGMHHNLTPKVESLNSDTRLFLEDWIPTEPLSVGDVVILDLIYGNESYPIIDAYGLTFELQYDLGIFEMVDVHYHANSWMSYDSPILTMNQEPFAGAIHGGYSRTDGKPASGYGVIGKVEFVVVEDVDIFKIGDNNFNVTLNPMGGLTSTGRPTDMSGNTVTFTLNIDGEDDTTDEPRIVEEHQVKVYPNPTTDLLTVHLNGLGNEVEQVVVCNITGQEVYNSGSVQTKRLQLDVSDYQTGMYMVKVFTNGGVFTKKFEVIKK